MSQGRVQNRRKCVSQILLGGICAAATLTLLYGIMMAQTLTDDRHNSCGRVASVASNHTARISHFRFGDEGSNRSSQGRSRGPQGHCFPPPQWTRFRGLRGSPGTNVPFGFSSPKGSPPDQIVDSLWIILGEGISHQRSAPEEFSESHSKWIQTSISFRDDKFLRHQDQTGSVAFPTQKHTGCHQQSRAHFFTKKKRIQRCNFATISECQENIFQP